MRDFDADDSKLEMTPMIDVTFLLLIFFMCTLRFKALEGKLAAYLPKDAGSNVGLVEPREEVAIGLTVRRAGNKLDARGAPYSGSGRYSYDDSRVIEYSVGPWRTADLGELRRRLAKLHAKDPERASSVDARAGIVYGDVVLVLDAALEAGFAEIRFVGVRPD